MSENPKTDSRQTPVTGLAIPEFDERMALEAIDEILMLSADDPKSLRSGHVVTQQLQVGLDCAMPLEAYTIGDQSGHAYVPGFLVDHVARGLFRDMWDTEIVNVQILNQGPRMVPSQDPAHRSPQKVFQVVAMATVRVTLRGKDGAQQAHTEVGMGAYHVSADDPNIENAYQIAIKGAVRDARQRALGHFGRVFDVRGQNQEELLERLQQRRSIDAEIDAPATQVPFLSEEDSQASSITLRDTIRDVTVLIADEHAFIDAYVTAIERATTIREMENFVMANAETLKHLKIIGSAEIEERVSGAIDRQYVGLSQFEDKTDQAPKDETPAEEVKHPDEAVADQTAQDRAETDAGNSGSADAVKNEDEDVHAEPVETETEAPSAPVIAFTLGDNGKIRKAKTYIKAFLAAIEAAPSREDLNLLMDANQENLKLLPRSELQAVNVIAQARAKKSGQFTA